MNGDGDPLTNIFYDIREKPVRQAPYKLHRQDIMFKELVKLLWILLHRFVPFGRGER